MVTVKTYGDRTLFFDFLPFDIGEIKGHSIKVQLYTVPGQSYYEASRRIVLRGADGVVFVADSDVKRMRANLASWRKMFEHLSSFGLNMKGFPVVVQYNKRDLPSAVPAPVLANLLKANGYPQYEAVAFKGNGVLPTLKAITKGVIANVQRELVA